MQSLVEWLILVVCKLIKSDRLPSMVLPVKISGILGFLYVSNFANCGVWFYVSVVASKMKCELAMGRAKWLQN